MLALLSSSAVRFMVGPAGKVVLLALAFFAWTLYQRHDATASCEAAELREELIESQRQLAIAEKIAKDARGRADETEREMTQIGNLYDDLKQTLQDQPSAACSISPDTRERLLRIK